MKNNKELIFWSKQSQEKRVNSLSNKKLLSNHKIAQLLFKLIFISNLYIK